MTEIEYRTEFSLWVMGAASLIVATDVRNMTTFMRSTLLHEEMLAIHHDALGVSGGRVADFVSSPDNCTSARDCQVWARPLSDGGWAMALYNRQPYNKKKNVTTGGKQASITGSFDSLPSPPPAGAKLSVRNVWTGEELGVFEESYTAKAIPPHGTVFLRLTVKSD
jgi:alpha-galactosidase